MSIDSNSLNQNNKMVDQYEKLADIGNGRYISPSRTLPLTFYYINIGSFGKVCKIKRKSDGQVLVWKELNYGRMGDKEKSQLVSEVNILKELNH